jgi:1-deoxy-D-xylulose-5-phosphate reductoisomerase
MLTVSILGATGSVGQAVCDVVAEHPELFRVGSVAGGSDAVALSGVARRMRADFAAIANEAAGPALADALAGSAITTGSGSSAVTEAAHRPADIVVAAISGTAGLASTLAAVDLGRTVIFANKETLVTAGALVMARAQRTGARILPLDSEHNALHQAMGGHAIADVAKIAITASGGPFRTWDAARIARATRAEALAHPNWVMGAKITIDSASLMNKGLELIEAHHLFGIEPERLDVVVHPQSVIHGLVHFHDGSVSAGLAVADMRVPAAHCLGMSLSPPQRLVARTRHLDLLSIAALTFEAPDRQRFPCLALAEAAMRAGGGMPAVLNAANEVAVAAFLADRIGFGGIAATVETVCDALSGQASSAPQSLEEALALDDLARRQAAAMLASQSQAFSPRGRAGAALANEDTV